MIAFDPHKIQLDVLQKNPAEPGGQVEVEFKHTIPEQGGTAWIRIDPALRNFFMECQKKHGVIGFTYDFEEGGLNFGLILKKGKS